MTSATTRFSISRGDGPVAAGTGLVGAGDAGDAIRGGWTTLAGACATIMGCAAGTLTGATGAASVAGMTAAVEASAAGGGTYAFAGSDEKARMIGRRISKEDGSSAATASFARCDGAMALAPTYRGRSAPGNGSIRNRARLACSTE